VREDQEKDAHSGTHHFRSDRTGEPKEGYRVGGRYHDHHLSGTGLRGGMKKRGGGGHNWGTNKDLIEESISPGTKKEDVEEKVEEKVEVPPAPRDEKKEKRKARKEQEKRAKKGQKVVEKKSDEISIDLVKSSIVDPNAMSLDDYKRVLEEKRKASTLLKNVEEKKEEKHEEKHEEKKQDQLLVGLFKSGQTQKKGGEKKTKREEKTVPNVSDQLSFPKLK